MPKKGQKKDQKQDPKQNAEASIQLATEALHEWQVCLSLQEEEVKHERACLDESRSAFEEEKRSITSEHVCTNDIIGINMGGEKIIQVKRSVLTQHEGTYLSAMFSGRWEKQLTRDRDGNVFFDESPEVLMPLIDCLRETAGGVPRDGCTLLEPPPRWRKHFDKMMDRFGLQMLVAPKVQGLQQGCVVERSNEWCKVKWDDLSNSIHWFVDGRIDNLVSLFDPDNDLEMVAMVESGHPYGNNEDVWHKLCLPFAEEMHVFFDPESRFEASGQALEDFNMNTFPADLRDYITFHARADVDAAKYGDPWYTCATSRGKQYETNFPSQSSPLRIPDSFCFVHFVSDDSLVDWGYRIYAVPSKLRAGVTVKAESCVVGLQVCNLAV